MKIIDLWRRPDCEVSLSVLRKRITAGEPYSTAKRLRNFTVNGKKYPSLWELAKTTNEVLTYQQLLYRIGTLKMTPAEAVVHVFTWVEHRKGVKAPCQVPRYQRVRPDVIQDRYKPKPDQ
jgi:hypothetical protein